MKLDQFKNLLEEVLYERDDKENLGLFEVRDLKYSDYLTSDDGLVIKFEDAKFIVTIQKV